MPTSPDPRIHVDLAHLRTLEGPASSLSFLPRQPEQSVLNGRHRSRLRGRGLNFEEMRHYQPGDDVRSIDWKATARTGKPHVRVFTEERDRPALLVVDQRMDMFYGSVLNMKSVTAAEAAALAAFTILDQGDRVGGIVFDDDRRVEVPARRSRRSLYTLLQNVADMNLGLHADRKPAASPIALNDVLGDVSRLAGHDNLVLIFSDFAGIDETTRRRLASIAEHNDLILLLVHDPSARNLEFRGRMVFGSGDLQAEVNFARAGVRDALEGFSSSRLDAILDWQTQINLSVLALSAGEPTLPQIRALLGGRAPRRRIR